MRGLPYFCLGYVADIYETLTTTSRAELKLVEDELKQEVSDHLHSMLEKESKEEAIAKHKARKEKETVIVPPTCSGKQKHPEWNVTNPKGVILTPQYYI